jgi:pimeloyl-ACP methyl ester carboxylesterase
MMRVVSRDGTGIAVWTSGQGPPLVVVHGTPADHTRWRPLLAYLEPSVTVHAMDRRGRGASGDAPAYELAREHEDVAAVVDAAAEASGSAVDLYGHSHGAIVAFGAATLTSKRRGDCYSAIGRGQLSHGSGSGSPPPPPPPGDGSE